MALDAVIIVRLDKKRKQEYKEFAAEHGKTLTDMTLLGLDKIYHDGLDT